MTSCKDCRSPFSTRVDDVRRLYAPATGTIGAKTSCGIGKCTVKPPYYIRPRCVPDCQMRRTCCDKYKHYWSKNSDIPCLCIYEKQPWFQDPIIQDEWADFLGQLVTPESMDCHLQPGCDDCAFGCNKVRSLMGPSVWCTWDLPEQELWWHLFATNTYIYWVEKLSWIKAEFINCL